MSGYFWEVSDDILSGLCWVIIFSSFAYFLEIFLPIYFYFLLHATCPKCFLSSRDQTHHRSQGKQAGGKYRISSTLPFRFVPFDLALFNSVSLFLLFSVVSLLSLFSPLLPLASLGDGRIPARLHISRPRPATCDRDRERKGTLSLPAASFFSTTPQSPPRFLRGWTGTCLIHRTGIDVDLNYFSRQGGRHDDPLRLFLRGS